MAIAGTVGKSVTRLRGSPKAHSISPWSSDFELLGTDMKQLHAGTLNISVAVWIGVIALLGIATDTGVVLATCFAQRFAAMPAATVQEVHERTIETDVRRVRPCLMTTATTALALLPVITAQGRGADTLGRLRMAQHVVYIEQSSAPVQSANNASQPLAV
jgi:hypothetical protein